MSYSSRIQNTINEIEMAGTVEQRAALMDLQTRLTNREQSEACLRCNDAEFILAWYVDTTSTTNSWHIHFARCGKFMDLSKGDDGFLAMPFSSPFFCTAMSSAEEQQNV